MEGTVTISTIPRYWLISVLLSVAIAISGLWFEGHFVKRFPLVNGDQRAYLTIAYDLAMPDRAPAGHVTDGQEGITFAPLYPAFLALFMRIDPELRQTAQCVREGDLAHPEGCPSHFGVLVPVQQAIACITLILLWISARVASRSERVGWAALIVAAFGCAEYPGYAYLALTENLTFPFFSAFSLFLLIALQRRSSWAALAAGIFLGLASLTRPGFLYIGYIGAALVAAGSAALLLQHLRRQTIPLLRVGLFFLLGAFMIVLPWMARNAEKTGTFDITRGYGGYVLAQRVAYDAMTPEEYAAGWIYWLPDFGHALAKQLFAPESYRRLGWDEAPDTYYSIGNRVTGPESLAAAGGTDRQVGYLIHHDILPNLPKFAAVTLILAWRGLWFGKYFSLVAFPIFVAMLWSTGRRRSLDLMFLSLPALFMLFFQAAVSVNTARYNIILIPAFSTAVGMFLMACLDRHRMRKTAPTMEAR